MKKYINAELTVVRLQNDVIATSDIKGDITGNEDGFEFCAPGRRYNADYDLY